MKVISYRGFINDFESWVREEDRKLPPNDNWYVSTLMTMEDNMFEAIPKDYIKDYLIKCNNDDRPAIIKLIKSFDEVNAD